METIIYKNKKTGVRAKFNKEQNGVCMMVYLDGPDKNKFFNTTVSTLKRWWKKDVQMGDEGSSDILAEIGISDEPYPEPKKQEIVEKPQSVIDFENIKSRNPRTQKPWDGFIKFEDLPKILDEYGITPKKKTSEYIIFNDKSSLQARKHWLVLFCGEVTALALETKGFFIEPNKDPVRPYKVIVKENNDLDAFFGVLKNV